eukprot:CAMPEP_0115105956 /NCGR_PEP_ID=MMETSP0227-20121206/36336_1 /TAXON_ID=89957 /ORGANISM="Polarella glacialis, Strain CCMP 1383" /LENGTH=207 /DNA_ID=CAMNT_0002503397 /DNA_START=123 /DNA_END=746 /DNA_ORIENTATION=+
MQVEVLEAGGAPPNSVIALSVGSSRGKVGTLAVGKSIPLPATNGRAICTVNIFQNLGTALIPAPTARLNDGQAGGGLGETVSVTVELSNGKTTEIRLRSVRSAAVMPSGGGEAVAHPDQAREAVQALMNEVLREQPPEPYAFMVARLKALQASAKASRRQEVRLVVDHVMLKTSRQVLASESEERRTSVTTFVRDEVMGFLDTQTPR